MHDATKATPPQVPIRPQIPRAKIWLFGALFFFVAISMYAGTMYRIKHYGYVGVGADQPITPDAKLTN
ncbi:hypothetical protein [Magnetovibrio blakemorei]|uniref:Uncharacterized protein n=1 Tax=Magnetovibrio blakemorei TaxID=28181 RepID=A0A1E5Q7J6_9PROT|nr:hypothetical protein [Magnetovibrio blakemorei]OEJ67147.1 hypothetical protein BEN30_10245 [Magnetovibrio blakemorei]